MNYFSVSDIPQDQLNSSDGRVINIISNPFLNNPNSPSVSAQAEQQFRDHWQDLHHSNSELIHNQDSRLKEKLSKLLNLEKNSFIITSVQDQSEFQNKFNQQIRNNMANLVRQNSAGNNAQPKSGRIIREVWAYNFQEEMLKLMDLIEKAKYIAMDTEFPGIVYPKGNSKKINRQINFNQYVLVQTNCNNLSMIQIGITLADEKGNLVANDSVCQQEYNKSAIHMLKNCGIDFDQLKKQGIDKRDFAEWFMGSGLFCNTDLTWIVFHGSFDFGYLLKLLTGTLLPQKSDSFFNTLKLYCANIFDIKFIIQDVSDLNGGLSKLADSFGIKRQGQMHQAGSDSLLTLKLFINLKNGMYKDEINLSNKFMVFGMDSDKEISEDQFTQFQATEVDNFNQGFENGRGDEYNTYNNFGGMEMPFLNNNFSPQGFDSRYPFLELIQQSSYNQIPYTNQDRFRNNTGFYGDNRMFFQQPQYYDKPQNKHLFY